MPTDLEILTKQYNKLKDKLTSSETLAEVRYCKQYPDLEKSHVIALIEEITGLIVSQFAPSFSCRNDADKRDNVLKIRQAITEDVPVEERDRLGFLLSLHVFAKGNQGIDNAIKNRFRKHKLPEENWESYVELAKQITKDQVHQITEYVYSSLPNTTKYASEKENIPATFAEKVELSRNSPTETVGTKQKRSVSFADQVQLESSSPESPTSKKAKIESSFSHDL